MRNKVYSAIKAAKRPFDLQLFAEGDGAGAGDGNGDGAGAGSGTGDGGGAGAGAGNGTGGNGGEGKPLSFDGFLKGEGNQAEFDRRVQKAIDTAVTKAQEKWQALADDKLSEAEKLAKMSKDEKAEYQRKKEREEFEAEKAEFEREKLLVAVKDDLQKQNLPIAFAESIVGIGDAEKIKDTIKEVKESWDSEIQEAIKSKARQTTPLEGGAIQQTEQMTNVSKLAREARIIK